MAIRRAKGRREDGNVMPTVGVSWRNYSGDCISTKSREHYRYQLGWSEDMTLLVISETPERKLRAGHRTETETEMDE